MLVAPGICVNAKGSMPAHGCPNWPEATGTSSSPGGWTSACAKKSSDLLGLGLARKQRMYSRPMSVMLL